MGTSTFVIKFTKRRTIGDILRAGNYDEVNFLTKDGIQKKGYLYRMRKSEIARLCFWGLTTTLISKKYPQKQ